MAGENGGSPRRSPGKSDIQLRCLWRGPRSKRYTHPRGKFRLCESVLTSARTTAVRARTPPSGASSIIGFSRTFLTTEVGLQHLFVAPRRAASFRRADEYHVFVGPRAGS